MKPFLLLLLLSVPALAIQPLTHTAKVISQDMGSYNGGAAVLPLGTGLIGVPIMRRSNIVVIQTTKATLTLSEMRNRHFLLLPVNGTVTFYADKNLIIMLDGNQKKHKFAVTHIEMLPQEK